WQNGNWQGDFTQTEPRDGARPTQETRFNILYDESNIYVAIRCFDSEPEKIDRQTSRRDNYAGDIAGVAFDSYFDHRTGFEFDLTAAGAKIDVLPLNDGTSWDMDWDPVWTGKTALEDSAWTIEMEIPFSQVRFTEKDVQIWGLHVWRFISRLNEDSDWEYIPKDSPGRVHLFGELHCLEGVKSSRMFELLPYTLGKFHTFKKVEGNPFATGSNQKYSLGLDGKVGITSDLTLDFTINPDFGQVEADPSVMNLSAYETFYSEKRPFFMEGKNILSFDVNDDRLFYSRRIGQKPHFISSLRDGEYLDMPDNTSILSALKLTGKTKDGWSIGLMHSLTKEEKAEIRTPSESYHTSVEPLTNYFAGRLQKDYNDGGTVVGGMFTAVYRNLNSSQLKFLNREAYNGGLDIRHRWDDKAWFVEAKTLFSHIAGDKNAILLAQTSPVHYYQRPDNYKLDSSLTSLSGHGGTVSIGKEGNGNWRFSAAMNWRSEGLELNDLGYLRQADLLWHTSMLGYVANQPVSIIRNYSIYFNQSHFWDFRGSYLQSVYSFSMNAQFLNNWGFNYGISRYSENLDTRLLRGAQAFRLSGAWENSLGMYSERSAKLVAELYGRLRNSDDGISKVYECSPSLLWRLNTAFNISVSFSYVANKDGFQYVEASDYAGQKALMLGQISQKTLSLSLRLDYYITPEFSIQYYANPFTSSGSYSDFKAIADPGNKNLDERFRTITDQSLSYDKDANAFYVRNSSGAIVYKINKPDFTFRQFKSNLVLRWEYSTGSAIYLVWSQGRTTSLGEDNFSLKKVMLGHSDIYPDNIFLVKFNHWFSL
ncbi:MAG: DUF5916 domain-containing protein, partial [Methanococcaceae archaeon]